jgi:hypothetical protein
MVLLLHESLFQEGAMRTKVTENGVLIPKGWLEGIDEVDIQKTQNMIIVVPVQAADPILDLGKQPIVLDVEDASLNHDRYLYDR